MGEDDRGGAPGASGPGSAVMSAGGCSCQWAIPAHKWRFKWHKWPHKWPHSWRRTEETSAAVQPKTRPVPQHKCLRTDYSLLRSGLRSNGPSSTSRNTRRSFAARSRKP